MMKIVFIFETEHSAYVGYVNLLLFKENLNFVKNFLHY